MIKPFISAALIFASASGVSADADQVIIRMDSMSDAADTLTGVFDSLSPTFNIMRIKCAPPDTTGPRIHTLSIASYMSNSLSLEEMKIEEDLPPLQQGARRLARGGLSLSMLTLERFLDMLSKDQSWGKYSPSQEGYEAIYAVDPDKNVFLLKNPSTATELMADLMNGTWNPAGYPKERVNDFTDTVKVQCGLGL